MLTYSQRADYCLNPTGQKLLRLMDEKKTNLALSVDVTTQEELLTIANDLGSEICVLKTHVDILTDYTSEFSSRLLEIAENRRFLIFEDRKFADIGNTVQYQYRGGVYRISEWADIINAHIIAGSGTIAGLSQVGLPRGRGLLLLAEMSPKESLAKGDYTKKAIEWAEKNSDFVIGFISLRKLSENPGMLYMTPGVHLAKESDSLGQNYLTPEIVVHERQSDVIIVGRGILGSQTPLDEARKYREAGWQAYLKRL